MVSVAKIIRATVTQDQSSRTLSFFDWARQRFKVTTHWYFTTENTVLREVQYLNIIFSHILDMGAYKDFFRRVETSKQFLFIFAEINLAALMTYSTSRDDRHLFATNMLNEKLNNASQDSWNTDYLRPKVKRQIVD